MSIDRAPAREELSERQAPGGRARSPEVQSGSAAALLTKAQAALAEAAAEPGAESRYARAHLAALRAAAAVIAAHGPAPSGRHSRKLRSAWELLGELVPALAEWAAFFAAGAGKRRWAEAGIAGTVTAREADDLVRAAGTFCQLVRGAIDTIHLGW